MNRQELQQLKMAWLAAKEAGDVQAQVNLLSNHPGQRDELIDFIAAYHASGAAQADVQQEQDMAALNALVQRATQTALQRVFAQPKTLTELRKVRNLHKRDVAHGLRLSMGVWDKFEQGAIQVASLSQRQLERLAQFFQLSIEQFTTLLNGSYQALPTYRRQTRQAAQVPQTTNEQFADVIKRSDMSKDDKQFWLE